MAVKLEDLLPPPGKVNIGRGELTLHGLELSTLARMLVVYKDSFMGFIGSGELNFEALAMAAPQMVTDIIAAASDTEDQLELVARIPIAAQIECLGVIYRLSVPDEKKLRSMLDLLAEKVGEAKRTLQQEGLLSNSASSSQAGQTS